MSTLSVPTPSTSKGASSLSAKEATLRTVIRSALPPRHLAVTSTRPPGASRVRRVSGSCMGRMPLSSSTVATQMELEPDMGGVSAGSMMIQPICARLSLGGTSRFTCRNTPPRGSLSMNWRKASSAAMKRDCCQRVSPGVAEGVDDPVVPARMADHRQGIRKRGAKAHPAPRRTIAVQVREKALEPLHHRVRPAMVRRGLQACELDRPADPVARIEGRGDEALALEHDRPPDPECPWREGGVVASLRVERDVVPRLPGEHPRPGPCGDHHLVREQAPGIPVCQNPNAVAAGLDGDRMFAHVNRAAHNRAREDGGRQGGRIGHMASVRVENRRSHPMKGGLHPLEVARVEHIRPDAELALALDESLRLLEGARAPPDRQEAALAQHVLQVESIQQRLPAWQRLRIDGADGPHAGVDPARRRGEHEAQEPRRELRKVAWADRQGPQRIEHPARQVSPHLGGGERHDVRVSDPARIAVGGPARLALRVQQSDLVPRIEKPVRGCRSDDARSDDRDAHGASGHAGDFWSTTWKPSQKGSRSSMKIVLKPVTRAQPSMEGMIASRSPTLARPSMRPTKVDPMMLSCTNSSPSLNRPRAARCAMRAEVPVPQGERSMALSP